MEIEVPEHWIADGFDLSAARLDNMVEYAACVHPQPDKGQAIVKIIDAPNPEDIERARGKS